MYFTFIGGPPPPHRCSPAEGYLGSIFWIPYCVHTAGRRVGCPRFTATPHAGTMAGGLGGVNPSSPRTPSSEFAVYKMRTQLPSYIYHPTSSSTLSIHASLITNIYSPRSIEARSSERNLHKLQYPTRLDDSVYTHISQQSCYLTSVNI